jgi:hypothetical protein
MLLRISRAGSPATESPTANAGRIIERKCWTGLSLKAT